MEDFTQIAKAAKKIMQMEDKMNKIATEKRKNGGLSYSEESGGAVTESVQSYSEPQIPRTMPKNSRLPKEILESMVNNPIPVEGVPFLDSVNVGELKQEPQRSRPQQIVENITGQNVGTGNIDYSLIKTIVESAVKKYISSATKKIISENTDKGGQLKALKIGDKFSFITDNGDIYEAKLTFKKNINE